MFVRDEDGIQRGQIFADSRQTLGDFAAAQARIDKKARPASGDEHRVARTAAGENADLNDTESP